ncbi:unnamed protein product [Linum tenue]|uniref:Uncharacterized protein n=1 Tax=Linum tenue TaxID=586396 RepID=A0AAV0NXF6_9ROSI|nr:unnamed protein product [Linum tenue]
MATSPDTAIPQLAGAQRPSLHFPLRQRQTTHPAQRGSVGQIHALSFSRHSPQGHPSRLPMVQAIR